MGDLCAVDCVVRLILEFDCVYIPGVSKGCLEVFKYLRSSKKHSFVTPGLFFFVFILVIVQLHVSHMFRDVSHQGPTVCSIGIHSF